jgi:anti-sigma28 factor (negative regulator of flagellin synthesis)
MKIGQTGSPFAAMASSSVVSSPARERAASDSGRAENDSVGGTGMTAADNREARIAELRQLVQSGNYKVDPQEVSRKIIDGHL